MEDQINLQEPEKKPILKPDPKQELINLQKHKKLEVNEDIEHGEKEPILTQDVASRIESFCDKHPELPVSQSGLRDKVQSEATKHSHKKKA